MSLNETDRPALLARRIWWGYGFFDHQRGVKEYQAWARHNRMGASLGISCGHAWQSIIAAYQKTFDAHPEYLALVKLMWNPEADAETILADFFQQAFGPAVEAVRRYYQRFDPAGEPLVSEHLLGLALRDLAEATKRAQGRPEHLGHMQRMYF